TSGTALTGGTTGTAIKSLNMVDVCNFLKISGNGGVSPLSAQLFGLGNFATGSAGDCTVTAASSTVENLFPYNPTLSSSFNPPLTTLGPLNNGVIKGDYVPGPHNHISGI